MRAPRQQPALPDAVARAAVALLGPQVREAPGFPDLQHRIARLLLGLTPGDGVLDVACGPGNFTREFAQIVGPGRLAVGIDASIRRRAAGRLSRLYRRYPQR